jgi:hypothetical protein
MFKNMDDNQINNMKNMAKNLDPNQFNQYA